MTATIATPTMNRTPAALTLDQFFEHVRLTNPFVIDRVVQPALAAELDADTVHQAQFRQLLELARTARDQHSGIGVVLWGEAGVGKSHLLSRLARWAHKDNQACFVYLQNLQSGPEHMARSLLRVTVSILTQGRQNRFHETPLHGLVEAAVQAALQESPRTLQPDQAYARLLDRLCAQTLAQPALVDRTVYDVLFRLLGSAAAARKGSDNGVAALAVRWLSGDPLDLDEAQQLGLPAQANHDETVALADDQQIKLVLVALSQMALFAQKPLILCFDQVENVDSEQIGALTRFLQAVLDSAPNLLVVTTGVQETLYRWHEQRVIHEAAWDRVAQFRIPLPRVTAHEARQIVEVRLHDFMTPFLEVKELKDLVQEDHLFPLGMSWFDEFLKDKVDLRPRHVIQWAREGWSRAQQALQSMAGAGWLADWKGIGSAAKTPTPADTAEPFEDRIDRRVALQLTAQLDQRRMDPASLPPDADNMAGLTQTLLRQCLDAARSYSFSGVQPVLPPKKRQRPPYHFLVDQQNNGNVLSVGVLFLTTGDAATSAAFALRRMLEDRQPPTRLVLVTDERRPLRLGARGKELLGQLRRNFGERFQQIELTFDQYAELDALKVTTGLALSGDLELDEPGGKVRKVTEPEVIASHHRHDRYAAHVLLRSLLGVTGEAPPNRDEPKASAGLLDEQDCSQFIMARLALIMGASSHELTVKYVEYLKDTNRPLMEASTCKPLLENVARALHQAGKIHATPNGDGLYLLPGRR